MKTPAVSKKRPALGKKPFSLADLHDVINDEHGSWESSLRLLVRLARYFGFSRIEPALLEDSALYEQLPAADYTLITFNDPDNRKIALRPELRPGLLRAFSEYKMGETQKMLKWFAASPVARYSEAERKFDSFWEYVLEVFGEFTPLDEAQLINLIWKFLSAAGLQNLVLEINSIGQSHSRGAYQETLSSFLATKKYDLCNDCVASIENDPMRVFRCKNLECKTVATEAPQAIDFLSEEDRKEFTHVLEALDEVGIGYMPNPMLVGAEGASRIVFQVKSRDEQNEYFIGEGAFHDDLYERVSGKPGSCFGFSGSLEVLQPALRNSGNHIAEVVVLKPEVFLVPLGDLAAKKALRLFSELWDAQISVHDHFGNIGVKNQLKMAELGKATIALIIGQKEAMEDMIILRDVKSGMQEIFPADRIIDEVKKRLGK